MSSVIDLVTSYQSEIVALISGVGLQYIPSAWRSTLRKSADFARWWANLVDAVSNKANESSE